MSNNRGGKRQANSPVGASFKDPRCEARGNQQSNRFDAFGDYESESDGGDWTQVTNGRNNIQSNNDEHQQQQQQTTQNIATTFAQVAAQGPGAAQAQAQSSGQIPPARRHLKECSVLHPQMVQTGTTLSSRSVKSTACHSKAPFTTKRPSMGSSTVA